MPPPNRLEAYMFLSCVFVRLSVWPSVTFFSDAITNEPQLYIQYLKMKGWVLFLKSQNSRWPPELNIYTEPILVHNFVLDWDIFLLFSRSQPKKSEVTGNGRKWPQIARDWRKWPDIAKNSWKNLYMVITLYWIEILTLYFVNYISKVTRNSEKWP